MHFAISIEIKMDIRATITATIIYGHRDATYLSHSLLTLLTGGGGTTRTGRSFTGRLRVRAGHLAEGVGQLRGGHGGVCVITNVWYGISPADTASVQKVFIRVCCGGRRRTRFHLARARCTAAHGVPASGRAE